MLSVICGKSRGKVRVTRKVMEKLEEGCMLSEGTKKCWGKGACCLNGDEEAGINVCCW